MFSREFLDDDALEVVERLQGAGHVAFLVGGCVRDLLLGREPKDFDIATSAKPDAIKALFGRRCRIIGRRFTLAHVRSGPKILEVATFRGTPDAQETADDDSGFVVRANAYGAPEEDARSRDFTVNGLFYDPVEGVIHDHVRGHEDLERRTLRTIGDADQRMREDPVRLLRAVKFASRLGFDIDEAIVACAPEVAPMLEDCPSARVTEEVFRILDSGHAQAAVATLERLGMLEVVLPAHARLLATDVGRQAWDRWVPRVDRLRASHGTLPREATYVLHWWPIVQALLDTLEDPPRADWGRLVTDTLAEDAKRMGIPVRHRQHLRGAVTLLRRALYPSRRRRLTPRMLSAPALPLVLTILRMRFVLGDDVRETYEHWAGAARELGVWGAPFEPRLKGDWDGGGRDHEGGRQPRRRRGRGRREGGHEHA